MLELHIWGPAFGLPSLDATCLAAITYIRECVPSDQWRLVPGSPAENPLGELPALKDYKVWIAGFDNVCDYLRHRCDAATDIDEHLSAAEEAERSAYASFILSRGQPLLDLSLYVSSENYTSCTRPALGLLLQWPDSWFVPHRLRDQAKKRAEHLGLSGLDVDTAQNEPKEEGLAAKIPESLKKPKKSVSALLGRSTQKNKFRLDAVTSDFFGPLDELLGDRQWFVGDRPTSLDCLAAGFLSLMQASAVGGQPWLQTALSNKFPRLSKWSEERRSEWFGGAVSASSVLEADVEGHILPWRRPAKQTLGQIANSVAKNVSIVVPFLSSHLTTTTIDYETSPQAKDHGERKQKAVVRLQERSLLQSQVIVSTVSVSILVAVLIYKGVLRFPQAQHAAARSQNFGAAGDFLGIR
jgi:sorting and assembly machinery component 37